MHDGHVGGPKQYNDFPLGIYSIDCKQSLSG